jgi:hypothetical protein
VESNRLQRRGDRANQVALGFLKNANVTLSKTADEETDTALRDWLKTQLSNGNTPFDMSYQR